jgi:hypothetical protein
MSYWRDVARHAWKGAAKAAKIETKEAITVHVIIQIIAGIVLWFALGPSGLESNLWGRAAAAVAPLLLFPLLFLWKFPTAPAALAKSAAEDRQRTEGALRAQIEEVREKTPDANERVEQLLKVISELLARQVPQHPAPAVPAHLHDLRSIPTAMIRTRVHEVTQQMRRMENAFKVARNSVLFGPRGDWDTSTNQLLAQAQEQKHRWQSELMPEAVALWNEMRRRIYGAPPYPRDPMAETALEDGMLAGVSPLNEAATALERLAREIPG